MGLTTTEKRTRTKNRAARRPVLGSWHTITERAVKLSHGNKRQWHAEDIEDEDCRRGHWKPAENGDPYGEWIPKPPITSYLAMYIGYRYKTNGEWGVEWEQDGWEHPLYQIGPYYYPDETVEIWLFVTHDNRNPVTVFPFEYPPDDDSAKAQSE